MRANGLRQLIKECIEEVLRENLSDGRNIFQDLTKTRKNAAHILAVKDSKVLGIPADQLEKEYVKWFMSIATDDMLKKVILMTPQQRQKFIVPIRSLKFREGFDPTSQGPNPVQENPYPAWNAQMRKLEETDELDERDPHGNYAKDAGAGQFDPRTFGPTTKTPEL